MVFFWFSLLLIAGITLMGVYFLISAIFGWEANGGRVVRSISAVLAISLIALGLNIFISMLSYLAEGKIS